MPGVFLWGWDATNSEWVKILVDSTGRLIIDPSEMLEEVPTDGEVGKAPTSNWAHDHEADAAAHHDKTVASELNLADLAEKAHGSLSGVGASDHHDRYADSEAVTAMGAKADDNPLNHDRYTDVEALAQGEIAVGTHEGEADPHTGYQKESAKDQASGYAGLDASGFLALAQIVGLVPALDAAGKLILTGTSQIGTKCTDLAALWDKTTKIDHGADVDGLGDDDHTQYILKALLTTLGDMMVRGAAVPEKLGVGNESDVLTIVSGVPAWAVAAAAAWADITGKPTAPSLEEMATEHDASGIHQFDAGDQLYHSNDAEKSTLAATYTKIKESGIGRGGEIRIKFDLKTSNVALAAKAKIYRNGVAVGTERTNGTTSYVTYSEDISGWSPGDLLQIYASCGATYYAYVQNLRLYSNSAEQAVAQDP